MYGLNKLSFLAATLTVFLMVNAGMAQEYGVKGGTALSTFKGRSPEFRTGYQVGGFARFGNDELITFKTELLLTNKGSNNWNSSDRLSVRIHYIDLPIMFAIEGFKGFYVNLGIQPSVRLGGRYRYTENGLDNKVKIGRSSATLDYATFIGAEYDINSDWYIGMRYNYSWIPVQGANNIFGFTENVATLRTFQIYAGLRWGKFKDYMKKLNDLRSKPE